ncbi:putative peroxiredoxin/MT2298 [bacterium BMS3Bbin02]|jgi:mycoredoxin-dependent peroxiredoxin|nr:putative peroxiredoxin/MT2298 [bacterium BMS3Bbin02]
MAATVGAPAPPFTLLAPDKSEVSLDDLKGKNALVVFIPFAFSGICTGELCAIRDSLSALNDLDTQVVAITCQTFFTNGAWSEKEGFTFPVLADYWPHGEVSKAYGVFNDAVGVANRYTFVLDAEGIVREIINTDSLGEGREFSAYTEALARLS